ncbi:MAG: hypothetical protein K2I46_05845 [Clostridia bacterium]|nr:hypothetical protein [Clostridia bacterium]MDE6471845.1 hypothetical protein [Clostridia bacterium]
MENGSFKLTYELSDYGKLLFDFDGNLNGLDMSKAKRKAMLRSPGFYYMLLLVFTLVVWFLSSLIANSIKYGFFTSVGGHMQGFFVLFVMCLIVCLSAFGGWGKFARWAGRGKLTDVKGFNQSEKEREEANNNKNNSIQIYEEYLVITNYGWAQSYYLDKVAQVILESSDKWHMQYKASFISDDGEEVKANVEIPREPTLIIQLKKIFGDKLKIRNVGQTKRKAIRKRNKSIGALVGLTCFVSLPILIGIGAIVISYTLIPTMPAFLGVFFIIGGCLGLCGVYDFIPALKDILVPLLFGSVFLFFPISLMQLVFMSMHKALTLKSFFSTFNVFGAAVIFFGWLGLLFVIVGIKTMIDYIRYREK